MRFSFGQHRFDAVCELFLTKSNRMVSVVILPSDIDLSDLSCREHRRQMLWFIRCPTNSPRKSAQPFQAILLKMSEVSESPADRACYRGDG